MLQWDANTESDLAGYKCYYRAIPGGEYTIAATVLAPTTTCTVSDLTSNGKYEFRVTAYNTGALESGYSNAVFINTYQSKHSAKKIGGSIK